MLSRSAKTLISRNILNNKKIIATSKSSLIFQSIRFNTTTSSPGKGNEFNAGKQTSTPLFDDADPDREHMFKYTWGTWLKNDEIEKNKRLTKFSIQGLNSIIKEITRIDIGKEEDPDSILKLEDNSKVLCNNIKYFFKDAGEVRHINQIISLHEGKHHRVYLIEIKGNDKKFILRLPYTLESELFTKRKIESEVATMDFLSNALHLNIPKVLSYNGDKNNSLGHAFILMEYIEDIEGSLMKKWNPLIESKDDRLDDAITKEKLDEVIEPIADFNKIVTDFIFDNYGSLYFKNDIPKNQSLTAFENQDRWVIGPTIEAAYYRNKKFIKEEEINKFVGPWKIDEPLKMIKDLVELEIINLKTRLELIENGENKEDNKEDLNKSIKIFEKLNKIADEMFNINSKETLIPNIDALIKPRLNIGDLDPMNVLVKTNNKGFAFIDFENSTIKPFLISNYPKFIEYNGIKIFSLREEIENFDELDEIDKEQYKFMFKRTRNQFYWEVTLNKNSKELVGVISPVIKLVKNCYLNLLNFKKLKDSLYIENGLIEISTMWDNYNSNGVIGKFKGEENPNKFSEEEVKEFNQEIKQYEIDNGSKPFIATGGWVPQDMFNNLKEQGIIIKDEDKNEWVVDTEKVLK